jgi:hypothetical protein
MSVKNAPIVGAFLVWYSLGRSQIREGEHMKTAEDVVRKLIERTEQNRLSWHELEGMGELHGYAVEHEKVTFVLDFLGDGTMQLRVNGILVYEEIGFLARLGDCVYRFLKRRIAKNTVETQEDAIRKAVAVLQ